MKQRVADPKNRTIFLEPFPPDGHTPYQRLDRPPHTHLFGAGLANSLSFTSFYSPGASAVTQPTASSLLITPASCKGLFNSQVSLIEKTKNSIRFAG